MFGSTTRKRHKTDWILVSLYLFFTGLGLMMIYSVGAPVDGYEQDLAGMVKTPFGKQALWLVISAGAWIIINYVLDFRLWVVNAYPIYFTTLILLLLVLVLGKEINGARSWFSLAGLTFQPSELAKFGCCLAMAAYLSQWSGKLDQLQAAAGGFLLWLLPALFIMGQPDAGSALVFASFLLVLYREGLSATLYVLSGFTATLFILGILFPPSVVVCALLACLLCGLAFAATHRKLIWIVLALATGIAGTYVYASGLLGWSVLLGLAFLFVLACVFFLLRQNSRLVATVTVFLAWGTLMVFAANYAFNNVLRPHHQERLEVWLRPAGQDPRGAIYNVLQSKLAISAGGVSGRGFGQGTMTRFDYVPEQLTDFVFCAVGEEQGFLGTSLVIVMFLLMIWRITILAERQKRTFVRAYAYGVAGVLLIHVIVNIGMTMGLVPVIGIPLPFISKGGSSLLSFTIMLAVLIKLDKHRNEV